MPLPRFLLLLFAGGLTFAQSADSLLLLPDQTIRAVNRDPQGNLLVAQQSGASISASRYTPQGQLMQSFTGGLPAGSSRTVLASDARGVIYLGAGASLIRPGDDPTGLWSSGLPSNYVIEGIGFDPQNDAVVLAGTNQHVHVVKLDRITGQLLSDFDVGNGQVPGGIAVDAAGAVYLTGMTGSAQGIVGFAAKLDPTLQNQVYFTTLDAAMPNALAVDASGAAYVVETPLAIPVTVGPPTGGIIHFGANAVYHLDPSGAMAGSGSGGGNAIAIDAGGNLLVTGGSYASTGAFQVACGPRSDLGGLSVTILDRATLQPQSSAFLAQQSLAGVSSLLSDGSLFVATQGGRVLHVNPAAPSSPVACIANGASYRVESGMVPGQLLTVFGNGLGTNPMTIYDDSRQLPFASNGTEVHIGGVPASLLAVSSSQINAIVPYRANLPPVANVEIYRNGSVIYTWQMNVTDHNPQPLLDFGSSGALDVFQAPLYQDALSTYPVPLAFAWNQDGTVNSASNPARLGSTVTIFASGFGPLFGLATADGAPAGAIPQWPLEPVPVSTPNGPLEVPLLGVETIAGHSNALLQVVATIPPNFPPGPLPFVIGPLPGVSGVPVWTNFLYTAR